MSVQSTEPVSPLAKSLSEYIAGVAAQPLPPAVAEKTRHHVLDTLAAIVSGSRLRAGQLGAAYVSRLAGVGEALVIGTSLLVPAEFAALANAMSGHADETDDSHLGGQFHPGCGIVPAALAVAELKECSGAEFIRAVAVGYDIGARINMSMGYSNPNNSPGHSTHSLGTAFGAAAAAAALMEFDAQRVRFVLSYACQQASGVPYWHRDGEHVEKAFDFGGMGARNGVCGALMVGAGWSGIEDPFAGRNHFFTAFGEKPAPEELTRELGTRFEIMEASIKKWCVGSPIQAVLDATTALVNDHHVRPDDIKAIRITMPDDRMHIVDNRSSPDLCVQHLVSIAIVDGTVSFAATHDHQRMSDAIIKSVRSRITMIASPELTIAKPARQAIVEFDLVNGTTVRHHAKAVRGTPDNPMTTQEIEDKARDLVAPIIGTERAGKLVETVRNIEATRSMRELRPLLQA